MNKKIVSVVLLLMVVYLVGIPAVSAEVAKPYLPFHHTPTPTETCKPTETHTPKPTVTQTPTPVPEYPSLVLPMAAIMGLMMLLIYRRGNK